MIGRDYNNFSIFSKIFINQASSQKTQKDRISLLFPYSNKNTKVLESCERQIKKIQRSVDSLRKSKKITTQVKLNNLNQLHEKLLSLKAEIASPNSSSSADLQGKVSFYYKQEIANRISVAITQIRYAQTEQNLGILQRLFDSEISSDTLTALRLAMDFPELNKKIVTLLIPYHNENYSRFNEDLPAFTNSVKEVLKDAKQEYLKVAKNEDTEIDQVTEIFDLSIKEIEKNGIKKEVSILEKQHTLQKKNLEQQVKNLRISISGFHIFNRKTAKQKQKMLIEMKEKLFSAYNEINNNQKNKEIFFKIEESAFSLEEKNKLYKVLKESQTNLKNTLQNLIGKLQLIAFKNEQISASSRVQAQLELLEVTLDLEPSAEALEYKQILLEFLKLQENIKLEKEKLLQQKNPTQVSWLSQATIIERMKEMQNQIHEIIKQLDVSDENPYKKYITTEGNILLQELETDVENRKERFETDKDFRYTKIQQNISALQQIFSKQFKLTPECINALNMAMANSTCNAHIEWILTCHTGKRPYPPSLQDRLNLIEALYIGRDQLVLETYNKVLDQIFQERMKIATQMTKKIFNSFTKVLGNYPIGTHIKTSLIESLSDPNFSEIFSQFVNEAEIIKNANKEKLSNKDIIDLDDVSFYLTSGSEIINYDTHCNPFISNVVFLILARIGQPLNTQFITDSMRLAITSPKDIEILKKKVQKGGTIPIATLHRFISTVINEEARTMSKAERALFQNNYTFNNTYNCWIKSFWKNRSGDICWKGGIAAPGYKPFETNVFINLNELGYKTKEEQEEAFKIVELLLTGSRDNFKLLNQALQEKNCSLLHPTHLDFFTDLCELKIENLSHKLKTLQEAEKDTVEGLERNKILANKLDLSPHQLEEILQARATIIERLKKHAQLFEASNAFKSSMDTAISTLFINFSPLVSSARLQ